MNIRLIALDDSPADLKLLEISLQAISDMHFSLHPFLCWDEAKACMAAEEIDLLIIDHNLGDVTGISRIDELRGAGESLPILMLTGVGSEALAAEAIQSGADHYLAKSSLSSTEATIPGLQVSLRQANNRLCTLLGRPTQSTVPERGGSQRVPWSSSRSCPSCRQTSPAKTE